MRKGQAVVSREGVQGARTLRHQRVGAHQHDDGDHGDEEAGADGAVARGVVEDGDQGHAGGGRGGGGDVADAEAGCD